MNTTKDLFKQAFTVGLMVAGALILLDLLLYIFDFTGMGMAAGILISMLSLGIYIGFFIWGGRKYRKDFYNGYISYGKALFFCLVVSLVLTLSIALYDVIFYYLFDPERAANEAQLKINMLSEYNMPDEIKEQQIQKFLDKATPGWAVINSIIGTLSTSVLLSLISALFIKKREKISDVNL